MQIVNFISQADILRFLAPNVFLLGDKANCTLKELGLGMNEATYVREDIMAIQAIKVLSEVRKDAAPIVNTEGKLIGNFSTTDLRVHHSSFLFLTVIRALVLETFTNCYFRFLNSLQQIMQR